MNLVHYLYVFLWLSFSLLYHFATDDVKIHINNSGNKNLFLDASSHLYTRVCPSVGPSVRPHFRQNQGKSTFEQINVQAGILGSLMPLCISIRCSISLLFGQSINTFITQISIKISGFHQSKSQKESHVITSSYNHSLKYEDASLASRAFFAYRHRLSIMKIFLISCHSAVIKAQKRLKMEKN